MTDSAYTDVRLVEDIRQGRSPAETALYERFAPRVYYVALRYLRSREDAEDARAETFLRVLRALREGRLRTASALTAFILETTRNVIRERVRQTARVDQLDTGAAEQSGALSVEAAFVDPYARRAIERTIDELRPRERAFLRMFYYDELSKADARRRVGRLLAASEA